jgi:membrane-associated protein
MTALTDAFLTALLAYGPLALALALLLAALGVPLPATVVLLAGRAFVRQGVSTGSWRLRSVCSAASWATAAATGSGVTVAGSS